jgi:putative addiction module component (TIGR02574 family)
MMACISKSRRAAASGGASNIATREKKSACRWDEALIMEAKLRQLTVDERIKLVEDLWDSIAADQGALPITADQKSELDCRLNAYAVDKNRGRPATDTGRDIRRKL